MDLEETGGVEQLPQRCDSCGAQLTEAEIAAALEDPGEMTLCARCSSERVTDAEELED